MSLIGIKLMKGGKLIASRWNRDTKEAEEIDATNYLLYHFNDELEIEDGVTFRDLMLLVRPHCDVLSPIVTKESDTLGKILAEGLDKPEKKSKSLEYVEISWRASVDKYGKDDATDFHKWVSFDGVGRPEEGEHMKDWPADKPVPYALDFTPAYELAGLPLKLNNKLIIYDERESMANAPVLFEAEDNFTLYDVLLGAFWELSFHGDPDARNERLEELNQTVQEIEDGTAELIPWEDVKEKLEERLKDIKDGNES
jgi:hypothetical protein